MTPPLTASAALLAVGLAFASATPGAAQSQWQVTSATTRVTCPITVGGSFEVTSTSMRGTLTSAANESRNYDGEIVLDLKTLDSGISLRNTHMRETYLEVGRGPGFDTAVMQNIKLTNAVTANGGRSPFTATLRLHGVTREVKGDADVRPTASDVRVDATFPLSLQTFEIAPPRYLGIGVKDEIKVRVTLVAAPAPKDAR